MNPGKVFGEGGSGFMRMNIGTPKSSIEQILLSIRQSISK
jgi:cystathionine beta-lyase